MKTAKSKSTKTAAPATATTSPEKQTLAKAITEVLASGEFEIPDEAIEGHLTHRLAQCEAQIKSLTIMLAKIAQGESPAPEQPSGRVDVMAATKKDKTSKTSKK